MVNILKRGRRDLVGSLALGCSSSLTPSGFGCATLREGLSPGFGRRGPGPGQGPGVGRQMVRAEEVSGPGAGNPEFRVWGLGLRVSGFLGFKV